MTKHVRYVRGPEGDLWVLVGTIVLLYVNPAGTVILPGDLHAYGTIPPPP